MRNKQSQKLLIALAIAAQAPLASAGLMVETYASGTATPDTLGGWAMTDIGDTGGSYSLASSISSSAFTGSIDFKNYYGESLDMFRVDASDISGWWNNPELTDNEVFTTSIDWVELVLPENTRAISFNVGASFNGWGWTAGYSDNGNTTFSSFGLAPGVTPGFGMYANNQGDECGQITSVIIDPRQWGVGNLSISQSDQCRASVPEPGVISLLAVGLAGLVFARLRS